MYYLLRCSGPPEAARARVGAVTSTSVPWREGRRFEAPPAPPILVELDAWDPVELVPMVDDGVLLLSARMVRCLREAGVDNLECFEAVVVDSLTGSTYTHYNATNIVGLVSCADLSLSTYEAPSGLPVLDTDFETLVLSEDRPMDLLMFRLAEDAAGIVIHERVKRALERGGIRYLKFHEPELWPG